MKLFRIARSGYIDDLSGEGARIYGGRWNEKGIPAIYASESLSLAALEYLVHVPLVLAPPDLLYRTLSIPDNVKQSIVRATSLPEGWDTLPFSDETVQIGSRWARSNKPLLLRVPSVIVPGEFNYLINPGHPDFRKVKAGRPQPFVFDDRLLDHNQ